MTPELRILIAGLATYRMAELITLDDGPAEIFDRIRKFFGKRTESYFCKEMALLLNCPFCMGVWFSMIFGAMVLFPSTVGDSVMVILALAGFQTFLEQFSFNRK